MRAAWAHRTLERSLPLVGCAVVLIGLTAWGCSLDKKGGYGANSSGPGGGGGGSGGDGGGQPSLCGNGLLDPDEQCDDGNVVAEDGCDAACQVECVFPEALEGEAFKHETTHHCYLYINEDGEPQEAKQPWYDARYLCRAHGFELAAVTTPEERTFVETIIGGTDVWIGGNDMDTEGTHVWSSGEPWIGETWDTGEPSDMGAHVENCVEFKGPNRLHDFTCHTLNEYVCERHPPGRCGDGVIDGMEECDDGNDTLPGDGCTACIVDCETLDLPGLKFKDPKSHHCYVYEFNSMDWIEAEAECAKLPGFHFATMSSLGELAFIRGKRDVTNAWIGATDQGSEDTWLWSNGESWEFDPWTPADPMNGNNEDCLRFFFEDLTAAGCGEDHPYLCERAPVGKRSPDAP